MVNHFVQRFVPLVNFVIATAALGFQVLVLYPWHHQLEKEFHELQHQQEIKLEAYHQLKMQTMKNIEENLTKLSVTKIESMK
jgi:hypothetical protein